MKKSRVPKLVALPLCEKVTEISLQLPSECISNVQILTWRKTNREEQRRGEKANNC